MPPKLSKDKHNQGSKYTPINSNMYIALSENNLNQNPTKTISNAVTMITPTTFQNITHKHAT